MTLSEKEQAWAMEHMKEDFTVGFSEKLKFLKDGNVEAITGKIPGDEAESDGYFCNHCGLTQIPEVEEHVKSCKGIERPEAGKNYFYVAHTEGQVQTIDWAGLTEEDAIIFARKLKKKVVILKMVATCEEESN